MEPKINFPRQEDSAATDEMHISDSGSDTDWKPDGAMASAARGAGRGPKSRSSPQQTAVSAAAAAAAVGTTVDDAIALSSEDEAAEEEKVSQ
jgi:hypothetical protein